MLQRKFYLLLLVILSAWIGMASLMDTVRAAALPQQGNATATVASTITGTLSLTATATPTATAITTTNNTPTQPVAFTATAPSLQFSFSNNDHALTGSFTLSGDKLAAAPAGSHFELWLQGPKSKVLNLGRVDATNDKEIFSDDTDQELLANYDSAILSLEEDDNATSAPSQIIYSGTLSSALLTPLRALYFGQAFAGVGALAGAMEQAQIVGTKSKLLVDAVTGDDLTAAGSHAEEVLNVLDGANGEYYGDLDRDGLIQNPGDGYGLAVYLDDLVTGLGSLKKVVDDQPDADVLVSQTEQMLNDANSAKTLVVVAGEDAYTTFLAESVDTAKPSAADLLATVQKIEGLTTGLFATGLQMATIELEAVTAISPTDTLAIEAAPSVTATDSLTPTAQISPELSANYLVNPVDGAEYVYVPAGEFEMGAEAGTGVPKNEQPLNAVTTNAFWLQRTEVTNAQYALCVMDGACTPPNVKGWDSQDQADHPVAFVDWQQANAYAAWAGGRLPTEAEWEKACRSDDGRIYPWGNDPATAELANFDNQIGASTEVGTYPAGASPYGALDMSGNVWEWTTSIEASYPYSSTDGREDASAAGKRVARGGSFYYTQYQLHCSARLATKPTTSNDQIGFRVLLPVTAAYWVNPTDGAEYVYVPAGEFEMGAEAGTGVPKNEQPLNAVTTNAFWLQRTEVTNAQYALCVMDGACTPPNVKGWDSQDQADHPVAFVDWQQANAYAAWAGGRLPTEAEWEKACRSDDGRIYPWGNDPATAELANFDNQIGASTEVGTYPAGASPYGALDMSGNVWEWTTSIEASYPYSSTDGREDASAAGKRVARGGSFYYTQYQLHCSARLATKPTTSNDQIGFRVVFVP